MSCNSSSMVSIFDNKGNLTPVAGIPTIRSLLIEKGNQDLSAQSIREQYILKQRELGVGNARELPKNHGDIRKYNNDIKIKDFEGPYTTWSLNTRWISMMSP